MAELATIARPYAKAAFKHAQEKGELDEWSNMLAFAAAVISDETMAATLDNPLLTADKQADTFIEVCGDKLNDGGKNFISQLAQNKRLTALPEVFVLFERFLAEEQKTEEVQVTSAYPLSDAEKEKLQQALASKLGKSVSLKSEVDQSLIGGAVVRSGDLVIDGSVRGKLKQLSNSL